MQQLYAEVEQGQFNLNKKLPTVSEAFDYWLADRRGEVKPRTLEGYDSYRSYIVGPLLSGSADERRLFTATGTATSGCKLLPMLGAHLVTELTTADIRLWHRTVAEQVGSYSANKALQFLKAALALVAEDFNVRPPVAPKRISKARSKAKKAILVPEQVKLLLEAAREDEKNGLYYAFPFLAGTRPSEQLALHWDDVDFERNVLTIRRMLEKDGTLTNFTKTQRQYSACGALS